MVISCFQLQPRITDALAPTSAFVALPSSSLPLLVQAREGQVLEITRQGGHTQRQQLHIAGQAGGMSPTRLSSTADTPAHIKLTVSSNLPSDQVPHCASPCCVRSQSPNQKPTHIFTQSEGPEEECEPGYCTVRSQTNSTLGIPGTPGSIRSTRPLPDPPSLIVQDHPRVAGLNDANVEVEHLSDPDQDSSSESTESTAAETLLHQHRLCQKLPVSGDHDESRRKELLYSKVMKQYIAPVTEWERERDGSAELPPKPPTFQYKGIGTQKWSSLSKTTASSEDGRKEVHFRKGNTFVHEKNPKEGLTPQGVFSHRQQGWPMGYRDEKCTHEEYIPSGEDSFTNTGSFSEEDVNKSSHLNATYPRSSNERSARGYYSCPTSRISGLTKFENRWGERKTRDLGTPLRSASAPSSWDGIPVIQPCNFQEAVPATMNGDVHIFSEKQPNGTMKYYAPFPVHSSTHLNFNQTAGQPLARSYLPTQNAVSPASKAVPATMNGKAYIFSEKQPNGTMKYYASSPVHSSTPLNYNQTTGQSLAGSYFPAQNPIFPSSIATTSLLTSARKLLESGSHVGHTMTTVPSSLHAPQKNLLNQHLPHSPQSHTTSPSPVNVRATTDITKVHDVDSPGVVSHFVKMTSYSEPSSGCSRGRSAASVRGKVDEVDSNIMAYTTGQKLKEGDDKLIQELVNLLVAKKKALGEERGKRRIREVCFLKSSSSNNKSHLCI